VDRGQPLAGGPEYVPDLAPRSRLLTQPARQGLAFHEFDDDEDLTLVDAGIVDVDDIGMRQARHDLCFAQQAGAYIVGALPCHRRQIEELQRHRPLELSVVRLVHRPCATVCDVAPDGVTTYLGARFQGWKAGPLGIGRWWRLWVQRPRSLGQQQAAARAALEMLLEPVARIGCHITLREGENDVLVQARHGIRGAAVY